GLPLVQQGRHYLGQNILISQTYGHVKVKHHTLIRLQTNNKQTNKADCSQFFIARTTHSNTHVLYIWTRPGHTARTRRPEVAVNFCSAFNPSRTVLPPGPQEQWAAFKRPGTKRGEPSVLVRDGPRVFCSFACFFCWGSKWRKPLVNTGRTCKLHTERPGRDRKS